MACVAVSSSVSSLSALSGKHQPEAVSAGRVPQHSVFLGKPVRLQSRTLNSGWQNVKRSGKLACATALPGKDNEGLSEVGKSSPPVSTMFQSKTEVEASSDLENQSFSRQIAGLIGDLFRAIQKPAAVALLVALLFVQLPSEPALAARGGGRVGGRSFSAPSRAAPSRSYSAPSRVYSAPPVYSAPYFGGWGYGWGGPPVVIGPSVGFGFGGGFVSFLLFSLVAVFLLQVVTGFLAGNDEEDEIYGSERISVVRLQVGLLGMARTLQRDLERIADRADTSSPEGLHYVLTETVLSLLRHPDYCIYGYSTADVKKNIDEGEQRFNQLSLEERSKFKEETLVSVDGIRKSRSSSSPASGFSNEYIVVTILLAAEGELTIPTINNSADLRSALSCLGGVPASAVQAVEILWTPQDQNDSLTERELLTDYSSLRSL
eukprot:TRINITY_DN5676_c0_g1_i1.p1 TRINITY_DN5676_c0_g1~~TRINITY_DN5676_c0_g1_i1.p1  ORF type:complete len:432 (-),score=99.98 TRINITY_DN5676_c0_g1_i1:480-1775(-)